jgi:hypothetical protein
MLTAFGKLVLWALSVAGDDERFLAEIERMRGAISAALEAPDAHDALFALLRYLSTTHERLGAKRIGKLLKAGAVGRQENVIMDALDELRQEGREEGRDEGERVGREEGERIGRARLLLKQLTARFGRVPAEAKAQVPAAKEPALDRWAVRVLTARSSKGRSAMRSLDTTSWSNSSSRTTPSRPSRRDRMPTGRDQPKTRCWKRNPCAVKRAKSPSRLTHVQPSAMASAACCASATSFPVTPVARQRRAVSPQ